MIPHSENDSSVFEANVLIVHFSWWSSVSSTLRRKENMLAVLFFNAQAAIREKGKKASLRMTDLEEPTVQEKGKSCCRI